MVPLKPRDESKQTRWGGVKNPTETESAPGRHNDDKQKAAATRAWMREQRRKRSIERENQRKAEAESSAKIAARLAALNARRRHKRERAGHEVDTESQRANGAESTPVVAEPGAGPAIDQSGRLATLIETESRRIDNKLRQLEAVDFPRTAHIHSRIQRLHAELRCELMNGVGKLNDNGVAPDVGRSEDETLSSRSRTDDACDLDVKPATELSQQPGLGRVEVHTSTTDEIEVAQVPPERSDADKATTASEVERPLALDATEELRVENESIPGSAVVVGGKNPITPPGIALDGSLSLLVGGEAAGVLPTPLNPPPLVVASEEVPRPRIESGVVLPGPTNDKMLEIRARPHEVLRVNAAVSLRRVADDNILQILQRRMQSQSISTAASDPMATLPSVESAYKDTIAKGKAEVGHVSPSSDDHIDEYAYSDDFEDEGEDDLAQNGNLNDASAADLIRAFVEDANEVDSYDDPEPSTDCAAIGQGDNIQSVQRKNPQLSPAQNRDQNQSKLQNSMRVARTYDTASHPILQTEPNSQDICHEVEESQPESGTPTSENITAGLENGREDANLSVRRTATLLNHVEETPLHSHELPHEPRATADGQTHEQVPGVGHKQKPATSTKTGPKRSPTALYLEVSAQLMLNDALDRSIMHLAELNGARQVAEVQQENAMLTEIVRASADRYVAFETEFGRQRAEIDLLEKDKCELEVQRKRADLLEDQLASARKREEDERMQLQKQIEREHALLVQKRGDMDKLAILELSMHKANLAHSAALEEAAAASAAAVSAANLSSRNEAQLVGDGIAQPAVLGQQLQPKPETYSHSEEISEDLVSASEANETIHSVPFDESYSEDFDSVTESIVENIDRGDALGTRTTEIKSQRPKLAVTGGGIHRSPTTPTPTPTGTGQRTAIFVTDGDKRPAVVLPSTDESISPVHAHDVSHEGSSFSENSTTVRKALAITVPTASEHAALVAKEEIKIQHRKQRLENISAQQNELQKYAENRLVAEKAALHDLASKIIQRHKAGYKPSTEAVQSVHAMKVHAKPSQSFTHADVPSGAGASHPPSTGTNGVEQSSDSILDEVPYNSDGHGPSIEEDLEIVADDTILGHESLGDISEDIISESFTNDDHGSSIADDISFEVNVTTPTSIRGNEPAQLAAAPVAEVDTDASYSDTFTSETAGDDADFIEKEISPRMSPTIGVAAVPQFQLDTSPSSSTSSMLSPGVTSDDERMLEKKKRNRDELFRRIKKEHKKLLRQERRGKKAAFLEEVANVDRTTEDYLQTLDYLQRLQESPHQRIGNDDTAKTPTQTHASPGSPFRPPPVSSVSSPTELVKVLRESGIVGTSVISEVTPNTAALVTHSMASATRPKESIYYETTRQLHESASKIGVSQPFSPQTDDVRVLPTSAKQPVQVVEVTSDTVDQIASMLISDLLASDALLNRVAEQQLAAGTMQPRSGAASPVPTATTSATPQYDDVLQMPASPPGILGKGDEGLLSPLILTPASARVSGVATDIDSVCDVGSCIVKWFLSLPKSETTLFPLKWEECKVVLRHSTGAITASQELHNQLVFDCVQSILRELCEQRHAGTVPSWRANGFGASRFPRRPPPPHELESVVLARLKALSTYQHAPESDVFESILAEQVARDEADWVTYERDAAAVKLVVGDALLEDLLADAMDVASSILARRV